MITTFNRSQSIISKMNNVNSSEIYHTIKKNWQITSITFYERRHTNDKWREWDSISENSNSKC